MYVHETWRRWRFRQHIMRGVVQTHKNSSSEPGNRHTYWNTAHYDDIADRSARMATLTRPRSRSKDSNCATKTIQRCAKVHLSHSLLQQGPNLTVAWAHSWSVPVKPISGNIITRKFYGPMYFKLTNVILARDSHSLLAELFWVAVGLCESQVQIVKLGRKIFGGKRPGHFRCWVLKFERNQLGCSGAHTCSVLGKLQSLSVMCINQNTANNVRQVPSNKRQEKLWQS